jgi:hypothetical protein
MKVDREKIQKEAEELKRKKQKIIDKLEGVYGQFICVGYFVFNLI